MKDYCFTKEERENYVLKYSECTEIDGVSKLRVEYSGAKLGKKVELIQNTEDNVESLDKKMDLQMNYAIQNKQAFVINREKSLCLGTISVGGMTLCNILSHNHPHFMVAGGLVVLFGLIPAIKKYFQNNFKVEEIEKAEYLRKNRDRLENISSYSGALSGVKEGVVKLINEEKEPFKMNNIDRFKKKDLEKIVINIINEENSVCSYEKKKIM